MARVLHMDYETRSLADLRECGVYRYVEDATTAVTHLSWRFDEGPVHSVVFPKALPDDVAQHISAGRRVAAHNAVFERLVTNQIMHVPLPAAQMDCTMARAATIGLPGKLDIAAEVMGLGERKDAEGHALMLRMTRPRKIHPDGTIEWWEDPERLAREAEYCAQDVRVESALDAKLLPLSARERRVWELDQAINDRGVALDVPLIRRALELVAYTRQRLDERMAQVTAGAVRKCSEAVALAKWITAQGVPCDSVAKDQHARLLQDAHALGREDVAEAIELRVASSNTSVNKLDTMLACVCRDGRARGLLAYHGASTGRWAGRLIQPQNLPRVDEERDGPTVEIVLALLASGASLLHVHDTIEAIFGRVLAALSKCLRAMLIAASGYRFVGGDLSNIEGCVNAWVSGEEWKIAAYRAYQAGMGPDLYKVAYARSFGGVPEDVKGFQRQVGKVEELALGYQGSVGAFVSMTRTYGIKLGEIRDLVRGQVDEKTWADARRQYFASLPLHRHGLDAETWAAVKIVVSSWRAAHPKITQAWWDLQDAAIEAVSAPGGPVPVLDGKIQYLCDRGFLWCLLPGGRLLAYCKPRVREVVERSILLPSGERLDASTMQQSEIATFCQATGARLEERRRRQVFFEGYDGEKKRWGMQTLYGGLQHENICQAIARDVLVECMFAAEAAGYPVVLTVHDELLTEPPIGHGSKDELRQIMRRVPDWCVGLPLDAKCWEGFRYEK